MHRNREFVAQAASEKNRGLREGVSLLALAALCTSMLTNRADAQSAVTHVSVSPQGVPGNSVSTYPSVSADGRFVAFKSFTTNLVPGTTGVGDIFVRDMTTGALSWASVTPSGSSPQFGAGDPSLSADGRYVAMWSASSLLAGDSAYEDVFVRDLQTGGTVLASATYNGALANGASYPGKISGDGKFVAFLSLATNLVPNDMNGGHFTFGRDIFVRDLVAGATELVNLSSTSVQGNGSADQFDISFDGRYVVFRGGADNLVPNDTNGANDIFLRDRATLQTSRVSMAWDGSEGNNNSTWPSISGDARFVAFNSDASNLVPGDTNGWPDIFLVDRQINTIERVSVGIGGVQANLDCRAPSMSADGRWVCFRSTASNLLPGDTDSEMNVFIRDRWLGTTCRVDIAASGAPADDFSSSAMISADGHVVVYSSVASNIVASAANAWMDVFHVRIHDLSPASYCSAVANSQGCVPAISWSGDPSASASDGFVLSATQVLPGRPGRLLYSIAGPGAFPFVAGATFCLALPALPTPMQRSTGAAPCSGTMSFDFNTFASSGANPELVVSRSVWAQYWSRDPQSAGRISLTDAAFFVLGP